MNLQAELIKVSKSMQSKILTFVFKILCCLLVDTFFNVIYESLVISIWYSKELRCKLHF